MRSLIRYFPNRGYQSHVLHPAKRYARVEKPAADRALVNLSVLKFSLSKPLRG